MLWHLSMVYTAKGLIKFECRMLYSAKKSLHQLKQLYFELKEDVFSSGNRYGYGFDTKKKEQVLLRYFDPEMKMTDITEPKYV